MFTLAKVLSWLMPWRIHKRYGYKFFPIGRTMYQI